jgi:hypothetical protein
MTARFERSTKRTVLMVLWAVLICCVVIGALLPATSPVIRAVGRLPVSQKVLHFWAYTCLVLLALLAIRHRYLAVLAVLAMILLGRGFGIWSEAVTGQRVRSPRHVHQWGRGPDRYGNRYL